MVTQENVFLVDTTFLFENAHKTFFGAPLLISVGRDNTFTFGFLRDLLRIRRSIGVNAGILALSIETYSVTSKENIGKVLRLFRELGLSYVQEPCKSVLDISATVSSHISYIITQDEKILQLAKDDLSVIVLKDPGDYEVMTSKKIISQMGVSPNRIPTYLALTKGCPNSALLTKRQAIRLIELYGDLEKIYENLSRFTSTVVRKKLLSGKNTFLSNYSKNKARETHLSLSFKPTDLSWNLGNERDASLLKSYGFHSLIRLLKRPIQVHLAPDKALKESTPYNAVVDSKRLKELEALISSSKLCAIDCESDDKNPHQATLFGTAFSVKKGEAFYVSLIESDLMGITPKDVIACLKRICSKATQFIGHNVKYDYLLLRRNGIKIKSIHFDTMLAAYDCYGDWNFFNLKYSSERLLGKMIKSYKDIVRKDQTFLDLPFREIVRHACEDAEVTLGLYHILIKELERKGITEQYFNRTLTQVRILGNLEYNGISLNSDKLKNIRGSLLDEALNIKQNIWDKIGKSFDLDSQKEVSVVLNDTLDLREYLGSKSVTLSALEQLAINRPIVRLIVEYKRKRKQLKTIDSIVKTIREGKIYPTFNQLKSTYGQLTSKNPNLFETEGIPNLKSCFSITIRGYFKDSKRSLDVLENLSEDVNLRRDRVGRSKRNKFIETHPLMKDLDHDDLLLSIVIGYSDVKLSRRFMVDHLTISTIRLDLTERYASLFRWLDEFRKNTAKQGYIKLNNEFKYLDGLKSSNIEKRQKALEFVVRWLIQY